MARLDFTQRQALSDLLRKRRESMQISAREVGRRCGLNNATITRLERGENENPSMESLLAVATALELPSADLLSVTNLLPNQDLPTFVPYLRTKYPEMSDRALAEMQSYFAYISQKHNISTSGPVPGEDEQS